MTEWNIYTGSDEQIVEMSTCKNGFLLKSSDSMYENEIIYADADFSCIDAFNVTQYLICNPHPLAGMIRLQALTGQPVWVSRLFECGIEKERQIFVTTTPDWNIPNAEYSFTPFEEEV